MTISNAKIARAIVSDTAVALTSLSISNYDDEDSLATLGIKGALRKVVPSRLLISATEAERSLDLEVLSKHFRSAKTLADLNKAVAHSLQPQRSIATSPPQRLKRHAARFSSSAVMAHVCIVIGKFKNIDPSLVKPTDNLKAKWFFDKFEKRAISNSINSYFEYQLNHRLSPQIHPSETEAAVAVRDLGQITFNHL